jgi:hypothetical protein
MAKVTLQVKQSRVKGLTSWNKYRAPKRTNKPGPLVNLAGKSPVIVGVESIDSLSFPKYAITPDGCIYSLANGIPRPLSTRRTDNGYLVVSVFIRGRFTVKYVHRLIAEAFNLPRREDQKYVRHLDGNKSNNRVENLAWGTLAENTADCIGHGRNFFVNRGQAKLTEGQVSEIRRRIDNSENMTHLANEFGVSRTHIWNIKTGQQWQGVS